MRARRSVCVGGSVVGLLMAVGCDGAGDVVEEKVGVVTAASVANNLPPFTSAGSPGAVDGTTTWVVPTTPNGLLTDQSWFSIANAPDGNVYLTACDHINNSALYRLTPKNDSLGYLGDALSAAQAANNWLPGETFEKFHMRPLWYRDKVYLASADYSNQDALYIEKDRGFHWFDYDTKAKTFTDVSASEPNGVGAEHISIFSAALDAGRGVIYAIGSPTAHLYSFDIATGRTTDLGRSPILTRTFYNPGRFIWVDSRGRVYMTVATAGTLAPGEPATPRYVLWWDPIEGWGAEPSWEITEMLRTGQCTPDQKRCYIMTYPLDLYLFDDEARTFRRINKGILDAQHISTRTGAVRVRSMNLSPNEKKLYFVNDSAPIDSLFEWALTPDATPRELASVAALDARLDARYTAFTGHDGWDPKGRFYFAGFGGEGVPSTPNVYVTRIDPVRLKAALGILPGVADVAIRGAGRGLHLVRHGDLSTDLQVLLSVRGAVPYEIVTAPAGRTVVPVSLGVSVHMKDVAVIPDGDTYVAASCD